MSDLDFLSIKEAALICEVSASTIQNFIDIGSLNLYDPKVIAAKFKERRNYRVANGDQAHFEEDTLVCRAELESLFGSEIRRNFWNLSRKRGKKDNLRELLERSDRLKDEVLPRLKQKILDSVEVGTVGDLNDESEFYTDSVNPGDSYDELAINDNDDKVREQHHNDRDLLHNSGDLSDRDDREYAKETYRHETRRDEEESVGVVARGLNGQDTRGEELINVDSSFYEANYDSDYQPVSAGESFVEACLESEISPELGDDIAEDPSRDYLTGGRESLSSNRDLGPDWQVNEFNNSLNEEQQSFQSDFHVHSMNAHAEPGGRDFNSDNLQERTFSEGETEDKYSEELSPVKNFEDKISLLAVRSGHYAELSGVSKAQPLTRKSHRKQNDARALEPNFRKRDKKVEGKVGKEENHSSIYSGLATRRDLNSPTREDLSKKIKEIRDLDEKRKADVDGRSGSGDRKQGRVVAVSKSINGNQSLLTGDLAKKPNNDTLTALSKSLSPDNLPMVYPHEQVEVTGIKEKALELEIKSNEETIAWLKQRVQNLESKLDLAYAVCDSHRRAVLFLRNYQPSIWHRIGMFLGILPKVLLVNKSNQLRDLEESQDLDRCKFSVGA